MFHQELEERLVIPSYLNTRAGLLEDREQRRRIVGAEIDLSRSVFPKSCSYYRELLLLGSRSDAESKREDQINFEVNLLNNQEEQKSSSLLNSVQRAVGSEVKISWHISQPKKYCTDVKRFKRFSKPFIIPGRQDLGAFLFFGGLSATGYPWRDFALKLFERSGIHSEVHSLAGHTGEWADLRDVTAEEWIKDMYEKAKAFKKPPVVFCYSTSALVALEVERRYPGTFAAIVAVSAPLILKDKELEEQIDKGVRAAQAVSALTFGQLDPLKYGSIPFETAASIYETKQGRKSPKYTKLPLSTVKEFRKIQLLARDAASKINIPLFYAEGRYDSLVGEENISFLKKNISSAIFEAHTYRSSHGPQVSRDQRKMLKHCSAFLRKVLKSRYKTKRIPDFSKPITKEAVAYYVSALIQGIVSFFNKKSNEQRLDSQDDGYKEAA
ncbi:MAG: hypothetical protein D6780_04875 [Candidatus Dadabacteria bacterium]|nr:MAG: hypothetical protein D6780_04875 [Candidatus Dadabacteria bacterium]